MTSLLLLTALTIPMVDRQSVLVVVGAPGDDEYGEQFLEWAQDWERAAQNADAEYIQIGTQPHDESDKDRFQEIVARQQDNGAETLWIVLIGHWHIR